MTGVRSPPPRSSTLPAGVQLRPIASVTRAASFRSASLQQRSHRLVVRAADDDGKDGVTWSIVIFRFYVQLYVQLLGSFSQNCDTIGRGWMIPGLSGRAPGAAGVREGPDEAA